VAGVGRGVDARFINELILFERERVHKRSGNGVPDTAGLGANQ
jgi:hypothetical protein